MLQKVATTGVDLENVYDQTLKRIREQKGDRSRLGMEVLMWVSHAERPLRIDELSHALAVEAGSTDLDPENIRPQDTVFGSCLGLVTVDKETLTVRLIHYTLQEYLSRPEVMPDAHKILAQSCLTYLNYEHIRGLPANEFSNHGDIPFLEYSSMYWGNHAKIELSDYAKSLALELFDRYPSHISATILFNRFYGYHFSPLIYHSYHWFAGLHCASYFGIVELVTILVEKRGYVIGQRDCKGFTPLMWAARRGNEGVVRLLLMPDDVDPDKPDNDGKTLLWLASSNGHEEVVRLLLSRGDVNPDKPDNNGATPFWLASARGHEGVVRLLLARNDVDPDRSDNYGQTPLLIASEKGHEGVVRLLLTRDNVNPNRSNNYGQTPLMWASVCGHEGVVRLLLTCNDINPDKQNNSGQTPFSCACENGNKGVVRLLLSRDDVNPDIPDNYGQTPVWHACFYGHEEVVRLLLARNDIDLDRPNNHGLIPLMIAYIYGHKGIVVLLLRWMADHSRMD